MREAIAVRAINSVVWLANHLTEREVGVGLAVLERLAPVPFARGQVAAIRRHWRGETPGGYALFRRLLREVSPHFQRRLAHNLVVKHHWLGGGTRTALRQNGVVTPFTLLISPTMRCNLRCVGCYAGEYGPQDDLPIDLFDRVLREGKEIGINMVVILGGEPFMYEPLMDLFAVHSDVAFMVYTNGTRISIRLAKRLLELGNVVPIIGLEGFEEETDARRGKGTFGRVMKAMSILRKHGVPFGYSSMVTTKNAEVIVSNEFNDMLVRQGCLIGWHFLYMPVGRDPDPSLMPTPEQREMLRTRGAARIRATKPLFVVDFWNDAPWVGGCIAGGRQYVHINSRGDVEACIFNHFAVDNVQEKSLLDCLQSDYFKAIQARQPYDSNLLRPCMMIDHPQVFREIYQQYHPRPTEPGARELVGSLAPILDEYSRKAGEVLDRSWEEEFEKRGFTVPIGR